MSLLSIRNLTVSFATRSGAFTAVEAFDLSIERDEVVAIVGESGSGKSVAMLAVMGLLPSTATVTADELRFGDVDLSTIGPRERRAITGRDIAMIFQEPMSSLNPCFTVGFQIAEALKAHLDLDEPARRARVIELLDEVGIPDPARRVSRLSSPALGRHEPARDDRHGARLQAEAPDRRRADDGARRDHPGADPRSPAPLKHDNGMGLVLITHDMGVVAETADRVIVQYAGQQVEKNVDARSLRRSSPSLYGGAPRRLA